MTISPPSSVAWHTRLRGGGGRHRRRSEAPACARARQAVIHFAAHAYVGESVENPRKYFRNNVLGALSLLKSVLDGGIGRFVFSSTCAVYGIPDQIPVTEKTSREPINP
jgi:UDP-glucose 4-epimerase